ncbi:MAG: helix-turn-helix transcriptional regulator [Gulosibacter sp.]|uniref:helix-turn-helix transcriptional regulator n=1 Tax=Gulosibacter sp. TaxID=2817531 RepID=UPI003F936366
MAQSTRIDPVLIMSVLTFLRRHEHGYDLADMASYFGVSSERMLEVIEFLWVLEFPDTVLSGSENMFDFDAEGLEAEEPWVKLTHDPAARVARRFDPQELATVLIGLDAIREHRSESEREIIDRLSAKLLGRDPETGAKNRDENPVITAMRRALDRGTQLELDYFAEHADAPERRVVDPLRLEVHGAMVYLSAYCHLRQGMRWFRHDRILSFKERDEPIGTYSETERNHPLQVRGKSMPELELAIAPSAFSTLRPYLNGKKFPPLDADGFSRCRVFFRSYHVAAKLAAEHAGAVIVEGPPEARAFMASWAQAALANERTES